MKAIRPKSSHRRSETARGALSIASVALLLVVTSISVITTGCDDDDDDSGWSSGATDEGGLGGMTYVATGNVYGNSSTLANATLVVVTRNGGTAASAATGGMFTAASTTGTADGLLVFTNGVREILAGPSDTAIVNDWNLGLSSSVGSTAYLGCTDPDAFTGTLFLAGLSSVPSEEELEFLDPCEPIPGGVELGGSGGQEDAPLIHLLGQWQHDTIIEVDCGTLGTFTFDCNGFTRIRKFGLTLRMDLYESCDGLPFECQISGPALTDGNWSGLNYTETLLSAERFGECRLDLDGTLDLFVNTTTLGSETSGTATFTTGACLPTGTECSLTQTMSATRCTNCWPVDCTDGL